MLERWIQKHGVSIRRRLPERLANRIIAQFSMTTAQFAVAVLVIFAFVGGSTYLASQYVQGGPLGNIYVFVVCTSVFFIHLFTHLAQSVFFRSVTPGAITSLFVILPYCIVLYRALFAHGVADWGVVARCLPYTLLVIPVVLFAHWVGKKVI